MERQKQKLHSITQNVLKRNYVYKYVTLPNPREVHVFLLLEFSPLIHSPLTRVILQSGYSPLGLFFNRVILHSGYSPLGLFSNQVILHSDYSPLGIIHLRFSTVDSSFGFSTILGFSIFGSIFLGPEVPILKITRH